MAKASEVEKRLEKLRSLRTKLCKKESRRHDAIKLRDWMSEQLKTLHDMSISEVHTKKDMTERLADILCALEQSDGVCDE